MAPAINDAWCPNTALAVAREVCVLGDSFAADPAGFATMLSDIVLDGLVLDPEG